MNNIEYWKLSSAEYKESDLSEEDIWKIFEKIFNRSRAIKVASYKFGLIHSIIKCIQDNPKKLKFTFDGVFGEFSKVYWKLIVKGKLYQMSGNRISRIYKILTQFLNENPSLKNSNFEDIDRKIRETLIEEVKLGCSRNVLGALYGDSDHLFYSFNKKLQYLELNPYIRDFLLKYSDLINKINNYEWLKFLKDKNPKIIIHVDVFEN